MTKTIIPKSFAKPKTMVIGMSLNLETHDKIDKLLIKAHRKGIKISKQNICKLIVETNIDEVEFEE